MRSHNFARTVLRTAARHVSVSQSRTVARTAPLSLIQHIEPIARLASASSLRPFSSTSASLKKKSKKNAFAAVEEDLDEPHEEDAFEVDDDDLFGGVSDTTLPSSSSSPASAMSRVEFAQALETYRTALSWDSIDRGQFPSLRTWRRLASQAMTQEELVELLELAKTYRDRVGSLGTESGLRFALRASYRRLPELAVNAFSDRYRYGLEYDLESLWVTQSGLARKLGGRRREEILKSAEIEGAPVVEGDLFGVLASDSEGGTEGDGKAEAIAKRHELDMPLARAQLSIIDRMAVLATLSTSLPSAGLSRNPDPLLVSYIATAYINAFHLTSPKAPSNPLLAKILQRTDALVSLLTESAQQSLAIPASDAVSKAQRTGDLGRNLEGVLAYVARRGGNRFKGVDGKKLDPVRVLYRFMDRVDRERSSELVRKVEPLLQGYASS